MLYIWLKFLKFFEFLECFHTDTELWFKFFLFRKDFYKNTELSEPK